METHRLVITEDLNQYGNLFGGRLLSWVDEASFIAATMEFPRCKFVTIGMDKVEFRHSVHNGTIIIIRSTRVKIGKTSVSYLVQVLKNQSDPEHAIFETTVTFVNVDDDGNKREIPDSGFLRI